MIRQSIGRKIFLWLSIFSFIIVGIIGIGTKFILPSYYRHDQMTKLNEGKNRVKMYYVENDVEEALDALDDIRDTLGGEIYSVTHNALGRGRGNMMGRREAFAPQGNVTEYEYTNKVGMTIAVFGIRVDENYYVYEVSLQTLNQATEVMMQFVLILLIIVLIMAVGISYSLSKRIATPIRQLKELADRLKNNTGSPQMITTDEDEIYALNRSLNALYEQLQGNIYQLDSELSKERNSERLKKRFLAQATHELKTPIAIIQGYAEIIQDGMYKNEEDRERYVSRIYDESEKLNQLIGDVLAYTKMETGNYQLRVRAINVINYWEDLFLRYQPFVESKGLHFVEHIEADELWEYSFDGDRVEQLYKNLLANAVEHAKMNIEVTLQNVGNKMHLRVYNDGPPIDAKDLSYVFESFYKKEGKATGTGLGLAIVKQIVHLHHGDYRVVNEDKGVTFIINI